MIWENMDMPVYGELRLESTFAGVSIGDNWVTAYKAHVDQSGRVFPFVAERRFFPIRGRVTPHRGQLADAIVRCWRMIDRGGQIDYGGVVVSLPAWALRTREVSTGILIGDPGAMGNEAGGRITEAHVEALMRKVLAEVPRDGLVVTEIVLHSFLINGQRSVTDAVGEKARSLRVSAHVVLAEESAVDDVLHGLRRAGIRRLHAFSSPFTACQSLLTPFEAGRDVAVVEVDRRRTACMFYRQGELVRTAVLDVGSYDFVLDVAERLGLSVREFCRWMNASAPVYVDGAGGGDAAASLFGRLACGPSTPEALNAACGVTGRRLFAEVLKQIQYANQEREMGVRQVVVTGDDHLACRALKLAADRQMEFSCAWRMPLGQHPTEVARRIPGQARMVGAMRRAHAGGPPRPVEALTAYNETRSDRLHTHAGVVARAVYARLDELRLRDVASACANCLGRLRPGGRREAAEWRVVDEGGAVRPGRLRGSARGGMFLS